MLHEANAQLKMQVKDVKTQVSGETSMDKIMASDPELANELKSVARLQKQVIILKKSNASLRNKESSKHLKIT